MIIVVAVLVAKLHPILWDPMDYSPLGPSVHGKNIGVGCHFLLQGIFLTHGSNICLLHWRVDSLPLSHQGSLITIRTAVFQNAMAVKWWRTSCYSHVTDALVASATASFSHNSPWLLVSTIPGLPPKSYSLLPTPPLLLPLSLCPFFKEAFRDYPAWVNSSPLLLCLTATRAPPSQQFSQFAD